MKRALTMILALVLTIACSTSAFAQKHRHSDRSNGDKTEVVCSTTPVTNESHNMEEFGQSMGDYEPIDSSEYSTEEGQILGALNDTMSNLGQGHFFDYALLIPIIAVAGFFLAPVLIVGFILLYRYKRRKQRDQIVLAAINKGVEVPEEYRSNNAKTSYNNTADDAKSPVNNEAMNKGIRRIVTGIGIWILGASINLDILMGVGLFIIVLGGGEVLIHYLNNRVTGARNEVTYRQQPTSVDSLQKQEGTYEKSE